MGNRAPDSNGDAETNLGMLCELDYNDIKFLVSTKRMCCGETRLLLMFTGVCYSLQVC